MSDIPANGGNGSTPSRFGVDPIMSDVQRGLAWFIVGAFVLLLFVWVIRPPVMAPESMAQLNQMCSTLQNILLIAIGFFFGSSKSSQNKDDAMMSKVLDPTTTAHAGSITASITASGTTEESKR